MAKLIIDPNQLDWQDVLPLSTSELRSLELFISYVRHQSVVEQAPITWSKLDDFLKLILIGQGHPDLVAPTIGLPPVRE